MADELSKVLNTATVAGLASARSHERGMSYLKAGRVGSLRASAGRIAATVSGSEAYLVGLRAEGGKLCFSCTCPVGREGAFCKHCVAVALAWLGEGGDPIPTLDDARAHLETLPQSELVDMLIDRAHEDEALARQLLLRAARPASGATADVASMRTLIDQAFAYREFVPYREVGGYVRGIEEAIDALAALLAEGRADDVVALAEHALKSAERALDHLDDSDGLMADVIGRLEELHIDACQRARPDPVARASQRPWSTPSRHSATGRRSRATASSRPTPRRWGSGRSAGPQRSRCSAVRSWTCREPRGTRLCAAVAARSSCGCCSGRTIPKLPGMRQRRVTAAPTCG
jgi:hypothetical protein